MPAAALAEKFATHASKTGCRVELSASKLFLINIHETEQTGLLLITHGGHLCDAELRAFCFDEVMQFNAGFSLACVLAIEDGVAAGLGFVEVLDGCGIRCRRAGFEVDDGAFLDQIDNPNDAREAVLGEIGFNRHFYGVWFDSCHRTALPDVGIAESPSCGFLCVLLARFPIDGTFVIVCPGFGELVVEFFQRERFIQPACLIPCLQCGVNRIADMKCGSLGLLELGHIAEEELQPTLQKQRQP